MALKEGEETELVLESEQGQQHQEYHDDVTQDQEQSGSYNYAGVEATIGGPGGSNPNENKWNKNGFGQGKHNRMHEHERSQFQLLVVRM